jgi:hypothetical protein
MPICRVCNDKFPNKIKIDGQVKNISNRKRCLKCSPFGNSKSGCPSEISRHDKVIGQCRVCGNTKGLRGGGRCHSCNTKIRRYKMKLKAVEYLGGKCLICGYDKNIIGFDFHHVNGKDFGIGNCASKSWETVKKELDKCQLLCVICHRIEHSNRDGDNFIKETEKYRGKYGF